MLTLFNLKQLVNPELVRFLEIAPYNFRRVLLAMVIVVELLSRTIRLELVFSYQA
jgi:hypothetical protein